MLARSADRLADACADHVYGTCLPGVAWQLTRARSRQGWGSTCSARVPLDGSVTPETRRFRVSARRAPPFTGQGHAPPRWTRPRSPARAVDAGLHRTGRARGWALMPGASRQVSGRTCRPWVPGWPRCRPGDPGGTWAAGQHSALAPTVRGARDSTRLLVCGEGVVASRVRADPEGGASGLRGVMCQAARRDQTSGGALCVGLGSNLQESVGRNARCPFGVRGGGLARCGVSSTIAPGAGVHVACHRGPERGQPHGP